MSCSTPIAFFIFNRPDLTEIVFEAIRQVRPKKLLVVADGPRFTEEFDKCAQARAVIKKVDWNCEVLTNYADTNLGCRQRVSSGISWVFEQVEEAIILEDDCLPADSFFDFCENLLNKYRDDTRIMVISGDNFQDGQSRTNYSYYFSKYNHVWGWATWRRAWQYWDLKVEKWLEFKASGLIHQIFDDSYEEQYWTNIFNQVFLEGQPNTWDYIWTFTCWSQGGLTILPNRNLVSNIGFREDGTHLQLTNSKLANIPTVDIWTINHPPFVVRHKEADAYTFDNYFGGKNMKQANLFSTRLYSTLAKTRKIFFPNFD